MLNQGRDYMRQAPWGTLFPGLAIFVTVMAFNLLGDGLRDAWTPTCAALDGPSASGGE